MGSAYPSVRRLSEPSYPHHSTPHSCVGRVARQWNAFSLRTLVSQKWQYGNQRTPSGVSGWWHGWAGATLPPRAAPKELVIVHELPRISSGKVRRIDLS
jgi:hypothetical protein